MWISLSPNADPGPVRSALQALGLRVTLCHNGLGRAGLLVDPASAPVEPAALRAVPGVVEVHLPESPHPLVDRQRGRGVQVAGIPLGRSAPVLMAGPCAVESPAQIQLAARQVAGAGATFLRGGAFKPRTSPYAFSGSGRPALRWLRQAADRHGLAVVTEVLSERDVDAVAEVADLLQVGSRNMQNFALLAEVGRSRRPVLLKRGRAATLDEWLLAGEHLLDAGAAGVVFCERGVVGFDNRTRNLLDLATVVLLKETLGQPVVVDPSHAAGRIDLVPGLCRAALAAGADGLLVESHPHPAQARSDGPQALPPERLQELERMAEWAHVRQPVVS